MSIRFKFDYTPRNAFFVYILIIKLEIQLTLTILKSNMKPIKVKER